jgi:hypothetical protein
VTLVDILPTLFRPFGVIALNHCGHRNVLSKRMSIFHIINFKKKIHDGLTDYCLTYRLTQLRCTASFLNHDLYKVHILSSPACSCGAPQEDANHFFFVCTKYSEIRNELRRIAFLNLDNESNFLIAMSSLFHSLTVEGINDELVIESLQKGTIKLSPFRKGYIVVL